MKTICRNTHRSWWLITASLLLWAVVAMAHAGTVTYVYTDPQGTPLAEADAQGNIIARFDYSPYGSIALGTAPNGPGYTGHVNDPETGLVYMQARYYDPAVGRFLSADPVTPSAGNLFNFNRYDYANNSPIVHDDPTGMACGSTPDVSAGVQRMRDASDGCGAASVTVVHAFNSSGKAYYVYADGGVVVQSGNRPSRDNNPGDLRQGSSSAVSTTRASGWDYTKTSSTDRVTQRAPFAMFSSLSVGKSALKDTLKLVYGTRSIATTVPKFAPGTDHNNPVEYAAFLTRATGLNAGRTINSLNDKEMGDLTQAIGSMEGMRNTQSVLYDSGPGPFSNP